MMSHSTAGGPASGVLWMQFIAECGIEYGCQFVTQIFLNPPDCLYTKKSWEILQSYKKTLEFACLLGKKWLIKKNVDNTPLFTRRPTQPPCSWRGTPGVGGGGGRGRRSGLGDGRLWGLEPYLFRLRKIFCGWCCKLAIQPRRSAQDSSAWVDSCLRAMLPKGTDDGFFLLSFFCCFMLCQF